MKEQIQITITPRADCKICWSKGTVRGCSVPVPFGSGSCSLPDEFCDCVIEQIPDDENEYDIALTDVEIWKAGNCGGAVVSDTPNHHESKENLDYYGGYLVAESIGSEKHMRLIIAAPEMLRTLETILPVIECEAWERSAWPNSRYESEMKNVVEAIKGAINLARRRIKSAPVEKFDHDSEDDPLGDLTPGLCPHGFELAECCPNCKALAFENLINSAEIAAEMWDSNSSSVDPEEVHALLVDAVTAAKKFRGGK